MFIMDPSLESMFLFFTGHLFDLNPLTQEGGYTLYHNIDLRRMYRLNVCGPIKNAGCAPEAGDAPKSPLCICLYLTCFPV